MDSMNGAFLAFNLWNGDLLANDSLECPFWMKMFQFNVNYYGFTAVGGLCN